MMGLFIKSMLRNIWITGNWVVSAKLEKNFLILGVHITNDFTLYLNTAPH